MSSDSEPSAENEPRIAEKNDDAAAMIVRWVQDRVFALGFHDRTAGTYLADELLKMLREEYAPLLAEVKRLRAMQACGHPFALLRKSIESDYHFCVLCEAHSRRRDAEYMEKELRQQLTAALADVATLTAEMEREQGRWQRGIYDELRRIALRPDDIDGSGCDSGDPLDVSLTEIGLAFNQHIDHHEEQVAILTADKQRLEGEAESLRLRLDERAIESLAMEIQRQMCGYEGEAGRIRERTILTILHAHFWPDDADAPRPEPVTADTEAQPRRDVRLSFTHEQFMRPLSDCLGPARCPCHTLLQPARVLIDNLVGCCSLCRPSPPAQPPTESAECPACGHPTPHVRIDEVVGGAIKARCCERCYCRREYRDRALKKIADARVDEKENWRESDELAGKAIEALQRQLIKAKESAAPRFLVTPEVREKVTAYLTTNLRVPNEPTRWTDEEAAREFGEHTDAIFTLLGITVSAEGGAEEGRSNV